VSTWDEAKRRRNIKDHGLDFVECDSIWDNFTITREDIRHAYGEKRLVTFGILEGDAVVMGAYRTPQWSTHHLFTQGGKT
jgi:uncharacterized DUF497 family protein